MAEDAMANLHDQSLGRSGRPTRRRVLVSGAGAALLLGRTSVSAWSQGPTLPDGPFSIINGGGGGPADVVSRLIGGKMAASLGHPLVVEAKPGAGGLLAGQFVARSQPNGATLLFVTGAHAIFPSIHRKTITFDAVKDFAFISTISVSPFIISVAPDHPARTFPDLVAMSKNAPGQISFSSAGVGSTHHLIGELLQQTFGVKWIHVPYRGGTTGLMDVSTGRVSMAIDSPVTSLPLIEGGKLRPLAVSQEPRMRQLPDVPAISEFSPGWNVGTYLGLAAPAQTPKPIIELLHRAVVSAVADSAVRETLGTLGNTPQSATPEEFTQRVSADVERWKKLVAELQL
jgi:tripartite-type tricarboxylate transporter receptor subunit TctC